MSDESKEWSFTYAGPREAVDDGDCHECIALATKKSRKGPLAYAGLTEQEKRNCPANLIERRMAAGKLAWCPNHCGLKAALETHTILHVDGGPDDKRADHPSFRAFSAAVLDLVGKLPPEHTRVEVTGSGFVDPPDEKGVANAAKEGEEPKLVPTSSPHPTYAEFRMHVRVPRVQK
jgi:hypothetical protein